MVNDIPRMYSAENIKKFYPANQRKADVNNIFDGIEDGIVWPRNFDHISRGIVNYRKALERSINTAAVEVLKRIGIDSVYDHIKEYGFTSLTDNDGIDYHYALALGGLEQGVRPIIVESLLLIMIF